MSKAVADALQAALEAAHARIEALDAQVRTLQAEVASAVIDHYRATSALETTHAAELRQLVDKMTMLAAMPPPPEPASTEAAEKAQLDAISGALGAAMVSINTALDATNKRMEALLLEVHRMPHPPMALEFDVISDELGNTRKIIARRTQ